VPFVPATRRISHLGGTTTLTGCTVSGNSAVDNGGGLRDISGTATLTNCTVSGNSAADGGGISNQGTLIVLSSRINKNQAASEGGGISTTSGSVTITDSVINKNLLPIWKREPVLIVWREPPELS
jgi:predicted outer membrane repeat protein